jgi:outer membrane protein assembly factor BamB
MAAVAPSGGGSGDWAGYHRDPQRSGFDPTAVAATAMHVSWRVRLDGAVYAQPLLLSGTVVAATEAGSLYGIRDGRVVWRRHVGAPVPLSSLPCGNIDPLGITGTPGYDPATRSVLAVAEVDDPVRHVLAAVDPTTGALRWQRVVDPPAMIARNQQQRAALAVSGGKVWVAFGGLAGDCAQYRGWIVGVATDGSGPLLDFRVPTRREGGIWAPPGPVVGVGGDLYVAVGNGAAGPGDSYDHTDSVLRLHDGRLADWFAPSTWASENADDADLGSMGPQPADGGRWLVQGGKAGNVYLLDPAHLGGFDGHLARLSGCRPFGGAATHGSVVFLPCTSGVRAVRVGPGPRLTWLWRSGGDVTGSPVVGGGSVYAVNAKGGRLYRLDEASGQVRESVPVGTMSRFATPVLSGAQLFVPTMSGLTAVALSGR